MIRLLPRFLAFAVASATLWAQAPMAHHVVMISIDGLQPATYTSAGPAKVPTLRRLAREGAWADGVVGVTPTNTYPSHTTLITGVAPAVHGIYNNRILDIEDTSGGSWYWYARDIKVPTLPEAVTRVGGSTAAINWPVTVDAKIDYLLPEFGGVYEHAIWGNLIRALAYPRGLVERWETQGGAFHWPPPDADYIALAAWTFRTYRPQLMLVHLLEVDDAQHAQGPNAPQTLAAIERADARVQTMIDAVNASGLASHTTVVVVSDHGSLLTETELHPNYAFKQAKLLEEDDVGRISNWDAYFQTSGGSGYVVLRNPEDVSVRARVATVLQELAADPANGIAAIWDQQELRRRGADPRAVFGIDMKDGFYTEAWHDVLRKRTGSRAGHGFSPARTAMHASLIMSGPNVTQRGSLGLVRMTQIAPTIASWLGATLSPDADSPLGR